MTINLNVIWTMNPTVFHWLGYQMDAVLQILNTWLTILKYPWLLIDFDGRFQGRGKKKPCLKNEEVERRPKSEFPPRGFPSFSLPRVPLAWVYCCCHIYCLVSLLSFPSLHIFKQSANMFLPSSFLINHFCNKRGRSMPLSSVVVVWVLVENRWCLIRKTGF